MKGLSRTFILSRLKKVGLQVGSIFSFIILLIAILSPNLFILYPTSKILSSFYTSFLGHSTHVESYWYEEKTMNLVICSSCDKILKKL